MKTQIRSILALSLVGLTLIACNTVTGRQSQLLERDGQDQVEQSSDGYIEGSTDSSNSPSASLNEGPISQDGTSVSQKLDVWTNGQIRTDQQGAVEIAIVPVDLNNPQGTIDFEVSLNTHSVDLSMDLAALTSLRTDSGYEVKAIGWNGPSGGHHVSGILTFPSTVDGYALLDDAAMLELTLINLDAPERVFVWER